MDTTVTALGVTRRAVLTHSPTLHAKQSRGFDQTLAKAARTLKNLQAVLGPRQAPAASKTAVQARDRHHPQTAVGQPGHHRHPDR